MNSNNYLNQIIEDYVDFPKKGIIFKDILPILQQPIVFKKLIKEMSSSEIISNELISNFFDRNLVFDY